MTLDQIYRELYYVDVSGPHCKHTPDNIKILGEIIRQNMYNSDIDIKITKWDLYFPDSIHIFFSYPIGMWTYSNEVVTTFSKFTSIKREFKLKELGIL